MKNNNMIKSILSIILVLLTAFTVLTPAISAADAARLTYLKVSVYEPARYENPKMEQKYADPYSTLVEITWTDDETGRLMTQDDTFEYGKSYTVDLVYQPEEGFRYTLGENFSLYYVNASDRSKELIEPVSLTEQKCVVRITFECKPYEFKNSMISIDYPFAGKPVPTSINFLGNPSDCTCTLFKWIDDETGKELGDGDFFGAIGKTYTAQVVLEAKEGNAFSDDAHIHDGSGRYFTLSEKTPNRLVGSRSYRCVELIDWAYMTITAPVEGEHPDYSPVFPDDVHYVLNLHSDSETMINGVRWKELYDGENVSGRMMLPTDTFQAGKRYRVDAYITTESDDYYIHLDHSRVNGFVGVKTVFLPDDASFGYIFTCPETKPNYPLNVSIRSFLSEKEPITVQLMQNGVVKYTETCTGARATCEFSKVAEGGYTMRISKKNHVTRDYSVTVSADTKCSAKLNPVGDISGDGKVTAIDFTRANSHARGVSLLSGYELKCADVVNSDGAVTPADAARINSAARGVSPLW